MATPAIEYTVKARDEASAVLRRASGQVTAITGQLGRLTALPGVQQAAMQATNLGSSLIGIGGAAGPIGLAAGAVVALTSALGAMALKTANQVEMYDRLTGSTGATREQLQVLQRVFKDAGGSADDAAQVLQKLNKSIGEGDPLLKKLGITTRDSHEALLQLADIFGRSSDTASKQKIAQDLLGRSSADLIGTMSGLRGATDEMRTAMEQAGALIGDKTAGAARDLDKQMESLALHWDGALNRIGSSTVPWANDMVREFNRVWDAITGNKVDTGAEVLREIESLQDRIADRAKWNKGFEGTAYYQKGLRALNLELVALAQRFSEVTGARDRALSPGAGGDGKQPGDPDLKSKLAGEGRSRRARSS